MSHSAAYRQTLDYLYAQLPMFSRIGSAAIKKDLTNILELCEALGHPEKKFKSIHIAGTNGKGSTSHMLAAVFQHSGYKTGLYTSPHLVDFRERIRINGQEITEDFVVRFVAQHREAIEAIQPSFFEITVAMAFAAFAAEEVDIAVIETGLGGRLDSTNVIMPELSLITNISYDHTDMLGNTLPAIAREKAGIIKPGVPVIIGESDDETDRVFFEVATNAGSTIYRADELWDTVRTGPAEGGLQHYKAVHKGSLKIMELRTDLLGSYQQHNIKTILTATELLATLGWKLSLEKAMDALEQVKAATGLQGRWDVWQQAPFIVADVAHNPVGLQEVLAQWKAVPAQKKIVILGFVKDKNVPAALALFPKDAVYYCTNADIPRALPAAELTQLARESGLEAKEWPSVTAAYEQAVAALDDCDALLVTGSFFIVGEAMTAAFK
jgi:dihydrofolate synthase/folylpolyglutamate synthase